MYPPAEYEQSNLKVAYRFCDETDNEGEVFSILLVARAWTSVILAGKRDSHLSFNYRL